MTEKLAGREQVSPERHAVLDGSVVVAVLRKTLARNDIERLPFRQLLGKSGLDFGRVVIFRTRSAVATDPLLANPAGLRRLRNPLLVDHRVELIAHPPCLGLPLNLITVDYSTAIGVRADPVTARHRTRKLLCCGRRDLKGADATCCTGSAGEMRLQEYSRSVGRHPPVRRERHQAGAIRAVDGPRPKVAIKPGIFLWLFWKCTLKQHSGSARQSGTQFLHRALEGRAMSGWPLDRCLLDQHGNGIQVVGQGFQSKTASLKGTLPPPAVGSRTTGLLAETLPSQVKSSPSGVYRKARV